MGYGCGCGECVQVCVSDSMGLSELGYCLVGMVTLGCGRGMRGG